MHFYAFIIFLGWVEKKNQNISVDSKKSDMNIVSSKSKKKLKSVGKFFQR